MAEGGYRQINKTLNVDAFEDYLDSQQTHIPKIDDVMKLSLRIIRVLGQNPGRFTLQGTNTYIVGTGSERLIIDTGQGIPEWTSLLLSTLKKSSISLSHVLLTHWHGDHTGGVPDLFPHLCPSIYKHTPGKDQRPIADGQAFKVEGATVRALHSPGHSHDHMCFILEEEGAMFTGDNVLGHGTAAVELLSTWMGSLRLMASHGCHIGYPAHGEVIADLPTKIASEIAQKVRREKQVMKPLQRFRQEERERSGNGMGKGSMTVGQLVTAIYGTQLKEQVREAALESFVDEVLRKLAGDGNVAFEVRGSAKKWFAVK